MLNYPQSDVHKAIRLCIHLGERMIVPWVPQQPKQHKIRELVTEQSPVMQCISDITDKTWYLNKLLTGLGPALLSVLCNIQCLAC